MLLWFHGMMVCIVSARKEIRLPTTVCRMLVGWRSYKSKTNTSVQSQVCVSKMGEANKDNEVMVASYGLCRTGDVPFWVEVLTPASSANIREMSLSRLHNNPAGMVAHAARIALEEYEKLICSEDLESFKDRKRAFGELMRGLVATATVVHNYDKEFELAGYTSDDDGARTNTSVGAGLTIREPGLAGLGRPADRPGRLYTADMGVSSKVVVDRFVQHLDQSVKDEVVDSVVTGGFSAGVDTLAEALGQARLRVALSPAVFDRLAEVLPGTWAAWEAKSSQTLWEMLESVKDSGSPASWKALTGTKW